ncbi:MAG: hypothetical protein IKQ91_11390 [Oscillospiraceae bacterium]|nr:hypothetical protein [Oscillospiraceae bacterium]
MNLKRILSLAAVCLLLTGCGAASGTAELSSGQAAETAAETEPPAPVEKSMVTLGDSISYGYGMENVDEQRYSALLKKKLEQRDGIIWNDYNYALSGDDSSDLLYKLQSGHALRLPSSDVIIVCIGANNLLGVYSQYMQGKAEQYEIDPESVTDEQIAEIQAQIESEMQDQEQMTQMFQERIDENLVQLESDLEAIYQYIREKNTKADVYFLNIYNPYKRDTVTGIMNDDAAFYEFATSNLERANEIISDLADRHEDIILVDIANAFTCINPLPVIGNSEFALTDNQTMSFYDPHPNEAGQRVIADTIYAEMGIHT